MTASALWQFDQLSPEARNAAEGAARAAGLPLTQWLGRLIADTATAEGVALAPAPRVVAPPPQPRAVVQPLPVRPAVPPRAVAPMPQPFTPAAEPVPPPMPRAVAPPPAHPQPMPDTAAHSAPVDATTIMLSPLALEPGSVGVRGDEPDAPEALVAAIAREGLRQPILARRKSGDGRYEIIAGRRRWRAARRLGLAQIPTVVTNLPDPEAVLASLTENLGEATLSAIDEARAYLRLLTEFSLDPRVVCSAIGRDMTHVVRTLRLLGLSPRLRGLIVAGRLSQAQAYALLDTPDPERAADQMLSEQAGVDEALRRIAAVPGEQRP
ncbi:MAG TPA: ParB/RepB/Spo0J family partition protein [Stellaceae bacterium]|nr:ParB/RepB/Spo0J family partition protein [Stellaceae bacterium]